MCLSCAGVPHLLLGRPFGEFVGFVDFGGGMIHKRTLLAWASLVACGTSSAALAAGEDVVPAASEAVRNSSNTLAASAGEAMGIPVAQTRRINPIRLGNGIDLFASTGLDIGYDSNVTQAAAGARVDSWLFRVKPVLSAETQYRASAYALSYRGDYVRYPSYDPNSLMQNDLIFQADNRFTTRSELKWGASVGDHYDPVGSTDRSVGKTEADHYRSWSANGTYSYGAEEARGRLEFDAGVGKKRYLNNRDTTESADVANTNLGGRFFFRVGPKTRLVTELRRTVFDYENDTQLLDNTDYRALAGITWDASSAIAGTAKAGLQKKNYDSSTRNDFTGSTWEVSLRWKPLSYSSFDLLTGRSASDPTGTTGMPVARDVMLSWNHDWKPYLHSKLSAGRSWVRYEGIERKDREAVYSFGMMYDFRRWLGIGVEYRFSHRDSSADTYDYIRRISVLKLEVSF